MRLLRLMAGLAAVCPVLLGCTTPEQRAAAVFETCEKYAPVKSDRFYQCVGSMSRAAEEERALRKQKLGNVADALTNAGAALQQQGAIYEASRPTFIPSNTVHCTSRRVGPEVQSTCY